MTVIQVATRARETLLAAPPVFRVSSVARETLISGSGAVPPSDVVGRVAFFRSVRIVRWCGEPMVSNPSDRLSGHSMSGRSVRRPPASTGCRWPGRDEYSATTRKSRSRGRWAIFLQNLLHIVTSGSSAIDRSTHDNMDAVCCAVARATRQAARTGYAPAPDQAATSPPVQPHAPSGTGGAAPVRAIPSPDHRGNSRAVRSG